MLKDFKAFALRGNVLDLAVAVVIGAAFGKIITSLVNDIIMPILGTMVGDNFAALTYRVNGVAIKYGAFIQSIVDFVIIAFCIFMVIKVMEKMKRKKEEEPAPPAAPTQEELLTEIRDLLKKQ